MLKLYTYYRSSAAYRVRIALNLKKLEYRAIPVHLLRDGGQHHRAEYAELNPQGLLPTLEDGPLTITQSLANLEYLEEAHPAPERRNEWYRHWVTVGFAALERLLTRRSHAGEFCHGDTPTLADCCLVPQVFNAQRLQCPLEDYPALMRVQANCEQLDAFQRAAPGLQSDAG
jgi:glutathione S-transferase